MKSIQGRIEKLEQKINVKDEESFIFLVFVDIDGTKELHTITDLKHKRSLRAEDVGCTETDDFLAYTSKLWGIDVSSHFYKD